MVFNFPILLWRIVKSTVLSLLTLFLEDNNSIKNILELHHKYEFVFQFNYFPIIYKKKMFKY